MDRDLPSINGVGEACCGCGACAASCASGCITMVADSLGFRRPVVDADVCIGCSRCDMACPALARDDLDQALSVFWAKARDEELLDRSSSGALFGLLADDILKADGIVVGAAFSGDFYAVRHAIVSEVSDLDRIMRSKYVQSEINVDVYKGIRDALRDGKRVLFAGTACQVKGLKGYLGNAFNSNLLLCVDIVCHGVPSPRLWHDWIRYRETRNDAVICDVNLRSKTTGWLSFSSLYQYKEEKDNNIIADGSLFSQDWYMKAFLSNASLRGSCFSCPAKRSCGSDITLGDFWGIQKTHPEVNCSKGVSAVICNTVKGAEAFECVDSFIEKGTVTFEEVLAGNHCLIEPVAPYRKRGEFLADVSSGLPIERMMFKWAFKRSVVERVCAKLGVVKRKKV